MRLALPTLVFAAVLASCSSGSTGSDGGAFVLKGSSSAVATGSSFRAVDGSLFRVKLYEMRLSANVDCSAPYTTVFSGTSPRVNDLVVNPEIARVEGLAPGVYPCVALRLSDLIDFAPATTQGTCIAGTTYVQDFYRVGNEAIAFRDPAGVVIPATGTDGAPSQDLVWVFFSTNVAAVTARGYSPSQVVTLTSALNVPGSTTFFWSAANAVSPASGGGCEINPTAVGFR